MGEKQIKAAKKYVLDFLNKAVHKRRDHDKKKKQREEDKKAAVKQQEKAGSKTPPDMPSGSPGPPVDDDDKDIELSDDEMDISSDMASSKRKRDSPTPATPLDETDAASKKMKMDTPPPPPPPPPPPAEDDVMDEGTTPTQSPTQTNGKIYINGTPVVNGHRTHSPIQLATPSTNGSYGDDLKVKGQAKALTAGGL